MLRVDLHTHTHASPDSLTKPDDVVRAAIAAGIGVLAVTDHNEVSGAFEVKDAAKGGPLQVIIGEEIMTNEGEIIGLYLDERIPPWLDLDDAVTAIRDQGGLVLLQHPYDLIRKGVGDHGERIKPDLVEVFNARTRRRSDNDRAAAVQARLGVPACANSDAHTAREYGNAYTETEPFDAADPKSLVAALADGRTVGRTAPLWSVLGTTWARLSKRYH